MATQKKSDNPLLDEVEAFLTESDMHASYLGRDAVNDTALVHRLRNGGDVHLRTADKVRAFMKDWRDRHGKKGRRKRHG